MDTGINIEYRNALKTISQHGFEKGEEVLLGDGQFGYAWLIKNNIVAKVTSDRNEFLTAKDLKGSRNHYLVNIFDCWESSNSLFVIIEEQLNETSPYIDKNAKMSFVNSFNNSWLKHYNNLNQKNSNSNYRDFMMKCCKEELKDIIEGAYKLFVKSYDKRVFHSYNKMMFNVTCTAIHELFIISPKALLDFNENNIMFTKSGQMKFIDIH